MKDKSEGIVVLSLFDGMSGGQIALERVGIKVKKYYASEIDKWAMKITMKHYPETIQLGTIENWQDWDIETPDLIIAGSPCQGFSNAGHGLNFDDPRSKLFFTFCDILAFWHGRNPKVKFLLENVKMKKEWKDILTDRMKVEPVLINSALVSAQNRQRLYWANWDIPQPEDRGIFLKDIIERGEVDRDKSYAIDANYFKGGNPRLYFEDGRRQLVFKHQSQKRSMVKDTVQIGRMVGRRINNKGRRDDYNSEIPLKQRIEVTHTDGKSGTLSTVQKDNLLVFTENHKISKPDNGCIQVGNIYPSGGMAGRVYSVDGKRPSLRTTSGGNHMPKVLIVPEATKKGYVEVEPNNGVDLTAPTSKTRRGRLMSKKSNALVSNTGQKLNWYDGYTYRKLTPLECERLQTVEDGWTEGVSNTQRYKMLGNGWTIEVIAHIFRHMEI